MVVGRSRSVVVCVFGGGMGAEKGGGEWEGGKEEKIHEEREFNLHQ